MLQKAYFSLLLLSFLLLLINGFILYNIPMSVNYLPVDMKTIQNKIKDFHQDEVCDEYREFIKIITKVLKSSDEVNIANFRILNYIINYLWGSIVIVFIQIGYIIWLYRKKG